MPPGPSSADARPGRRRRQRRARLGALAAEEAERRHAVLVAAVGLHGDDLVGVDADAARDAAAGGAVVRVDEVPADAALVGGEPVVGCCGVVVVLLCCCCCAFLCVVVAR